MLPIGLWLCATGCQSFNGSAPGYLTSVTVTNRAMTEVTDATMKVMAARGFRGGETGPGEFTYRRVGSDTDQAAYGSYFFKETVYAKVQLNCQQLTPGSIRIGCNAWLIKNENDPTLEESHKVRSLGKSPYEELLKDIKAQLGQ